MSIDSASKGFRNKKGRFLPGVLTRLDVSEKNILEQIKRYNEANAEFGLEKVPMIKELMIIFDMCSDAVKKRLKKVKNEKVGIKTIKEWYKL